MNILKVKIFKFKKTKKPEQNSSVSRALVPYVFLHLICFILYVLSCLTCVQSSPYQRCCQALRVCCPTCCLVSCSLFSLCCHTSRASSPICLHIPCACFVLVVDDLSINSCLRKILYLNYTRFLVKFKNNTNIYIEYT